MSILDDFINRKGKSAVQEGLALLGKQKKRGRKANIFQGIGLAMKLKNYSHMQDVLSNLTEFEETSKAPRAGLVAEWTRQAEIHALDERLRNEHGDNLNFYFSKKARENWTSLTGYAAPDPSSKQFSDYQNWVTGESQRLTNNHEAKLKGATLGKLTKVEATAEFDRIVRATTKAGLAPSNINWFRGVLNNALGKGNNAKVNLDAISTHLDSLKDSPNSLNSPVTSGDIQVSTRDNRDFAETYVPEIADIDIAQIISNFKTTYGNLDISNVDLTSEIEKLRLGMPNATALQIQNVLLTKSFATQIAKSVESKNTAESVIATYLKGDTSLSNVKGRGTRLTRLREVNDAFNVLRDRDDVDQSIVDEYEVFASMHLPELNSLPEAGVASEEFKLDVSQRITTLVKKGLTSAEFQAQMEANIASDQKGVTRLQEGMANEVSSYVHQFAYDYPSISIHNNANRNALIQLGLLKYTDELKNASEGITLNDFYEFQVTNGSMDAEEYLSNISTLIETAKTEEQRIEVQKTALEIVEDPDNKLTLDQQEEYRQDIVNAGNNRTLDFLRAASNKNNVEIVNLNDEISDGFTYQDVLDAPVVGPIADLFFGPEFAKDPLDLITDLAMFIPLGWGASMTIKGSAILGKYAFGKALPLMGKHAVTKIMANPHYVKLIKNMRFKNGQFTTPLRKPLKKNFKNDPRPQLKQFKNDPKPRAQDFDTTARYNRALDSWTKTGQARQKYDRAIKFHKEKGSAKYKYNEAMKNYNKKVKVSTDKQAEGLKKYRDGLNDWERAIYDSMNMKTGEINGTRLIKNFAKVKGTKIATFAKEAFSSIPKVVMYGAGGAAVVARGYEMFDENEEEEE